ncbi:DUF1836 domain-containing protein [Clostridium thermobutyricum]|uniref:DUF1836 domain-containing protein n=1 Tax=Clostridium thermobutyricum TaxID=29372 RepID=UPI0029433953|nr:DUF1836 domain-containing protein [Clostridium thermobutyricum]
MDKDKILELIKNLNLDKNIELNEIPEIDLYMDQVIQMFESKYSDMRRNEDEKVLTKTMINNYAKGKLLMPIKNKKYSKEHIILMNLIYNLKGTLSISDIKLVLNDLVNDPDIDHIRDLYSKFIKTSESDLRHFKKENIDRFEEINSNDKFDKNFLMLCSVINMSNMYRKLGEKLIDELFDKGDEK